MGKITPFLLKAAFFAVLVVRPAEADDPLDNAAPESAGGTKTPAAIGPGKPAAVDVPPEWFSGTRDRTRGISETERDAYYRALAQAGKIDPQQLRRRAQALRDQAERAFHSDPMNKGRMYSQFVDIVQRPDQFRGKPVTLKGYIQGLDTMDAGENDEGLQTLHQAYLFTADSLQNPYVVVTREIPPDIPRPKKGSPTNDVSVTGYFFKIWSYEAQRGNWAGPLILADRLEWNPGPPPLSSRIEFKIALAATLALLLLGLILLLARQRRDDRRFRELRAARQSQDADDPSVELRHLENNPE